MKAATARTAGIRGRVVRTLATRSPTQTGTFRCGPPVTTNHYPAQLLRRVGQTIQVVSLINLLRQIRYEVWRAASTKNGKSCQHLMGKKHKNLFPQVINTGNLYEAYRKAAKGRQQSAEHLRFREHLAANIGLLRHDFESGNYRPGAARHFMVHEPKRREISAMPFYDRVAEHALCNVIEPIFDRVFLPQSFACRRNKGTHAAAKHVQATLRRMEPTDPVYVLKTDFSKYFAGVDRSTLHRELQRKIACPPTLRLLRTMLPASGNGLDIGRLISQLSANVYGHMLDRWLVHTIGVTRWARYMDDVVLFSHSSDFLAALKRDIEHFAWQVMGLRFSHWSIQSARRGVNFVGYRIWPTHKLLRRDSVTRAKRKLKHLRGEDRSRFLAAWKGHAQHANSHNLLRYLDVA